MRITKEQNDLLDSFKCERLSDDAGNEELMRSFTSKRGSSLVSYFTHFGMTEDAAGITTYYVIKDAQNEVMMFFSLKCGALFDPLIDESEVKQDFQRLLILLQAIENANGDSEKREEAIAILTKYQVGDRISIEDFNNLVFRKASGKKNFLSQLFGDKEKEQNDKIFRVQSTHPGIELVHFCTNDNLRQKWQTYNLGILWEKHYIGNLLHPSFLKYRKLWDVNMHFFLRQIYQKMGH